MESLGECHPSTILADGDYDCEPHNSTDSAADEKNTSAASGEVPCPVLGEICLIHLPVNEHECDMNVAGQQGVKNRSSLGQKINEISLSRYDTTGLDITVVIYY